MNPIKNLALVIVAMANASVAHADPIIFEFSGEATTKDGVFAASSSSAVSGRFVYDTSWEKLTGGDSDGALYGATTDFFGITFIFDGTTYDSRLTNLRDRHVIDVVNDRGEQASEFDELNYRANADTLISSEPLFAVYFSPAIGTDPFSSTDIPDSLFLADFESVFGSLTLRASGDTIGILEFDITELTQVIAVPEAGTLALLGIGLAGIGLARRRRKI